MRDNLEDVLVELHNQMVEQDAVKAKKVARLHMWLSIGKWFADNLVSIVALVISIVALVRTTA